MLTDAEDAMGHAYWDELHGRPAREIVERDDGFIESLPIAHYFAPYEEWDESTRNALAFVRGRVLDVGVGAGRHALYLQEQGHDVVGIDVSPLAVEVCHQRGLADARGCAATQVGPFLGRFDTVVMLGNNFGLCANRKRAPWLLRRLASICSPGARIVAQTNDIYATDAPYHLAYQERNRTRGRMAGQIRLRIRWRVWCTPWFDYLMVSPSELEELVQDTPWRIAEIIGAAQGSAYTAILERRSRPRA